MAYLMLGIKNWKHDDAFDAKADLAQLCADFKIAPDECKPAEECKGYKAQFNEGAAPSHHWEKGMPLERIDQPEGPVYYIWVKGETADRIERAFPDNFAGKYCEYRNVDFRLGPARQEI